MTRDEVLRVVREARDQGCRANLYGANLYRADLREANLRWADLREADLREANLRWADLREANLSGANLYGADLCEADLSGADLYGADLREANLRWADLRGALGGLLAIDGLPSGGARLTPTPDGWSLRVGCWVGTPDTLRDLIAGTDWPEAHGTERARRRPGLAALADLCDAHAAAHPDLVPALAEKWGRTEAGESA